MKVQNESRESFLEPLKAKRNDEETRKAKERHENDKENHEGTKGMKPNETMRKRKTRRNERKAIKKMMRERRT